MGVRICCGRLPHPPRQIPTRSIASRPAHQLVVLPSWEKIHQNLTSRHATRAIVEDPYLERIHLIPTVLETFAERNLMQGMIKVELTLMIWSYKGLTLPDEVRNLMIDNLAKSLYSSAMLLEDNSNKFSL